MIASKGQNLLWRIVNQNSVRRTVAAARRWSRVQDLVTGAGHLVTGAGHPAGTRLVVVGLVVTCARLVGAVVGLVGAAAGRWSLVQDWQLLLQVW